MYQSKYKHKHSDRRVVPEKIEPEVESVQTFPDYAADRQLSLAAQQQSIAFAGNLAQQSAQQQQMASHNQFGGIASLLGGGIFGR